MWFDWRKKYRNIAYRGELSGQLLQPFNTIMASFFVCLCVIEYDFDWRKKYRVLLRAVRKLLTAN